MLDAWLDYWRATILHKCAGLTGAQLVERSCPPSPLSLAGLVRHLTEMERAYVHRLADPGSTLYYCTDDNPEGEDLWRISGWVWWVRPGPAAVACPRCRRACEFWP